MEQNSIHREALWAIELKFMHADGTIINFVKDPLKRLELKCQYYSQQSSSPWAFISSGWLTIFMHLWYFSQLARKLAYIYLWCASYGSIYSLKEDYQQAAQLLKLNNSLCTIAQKKKITSKLLKLGCINQSSRNQLGLITEGKEKGLKFMEICSLIRGFHFL